MHESGHLLAARAFSMKVLKFSIGIGPASGATSRRTATPSTRSVPSRSWRTCRSTA
ncbi:MAG: site-2 protease family protein [Polyangiaceae bacterium]